MIPATVGVGGSCKPHSELSLPVSSCITGGTANGVVLIGAPTGRLLDVEFPASQHRSDDQDDDDSRRDKRQRAFKESEHVTIVQDRNRSIAYPP